MNWLRRFKRALRVLRATGFSAAALPWTKEDEANLRAFLDSKTGLRLGALLRHRLAIDASTAVARQTGNTWACGHAAGMQTAVAIIDGMAEGVETDAKPTDDRPSDNLDWLSS